MWAKNKYLISLACLAVVVCGLICCRIPEQSEPVAIDRPKLTDPGVVGKACELICSGEFSAAGDLIKQIDPSQTPAIGRLGEIVSDYEALSQRRRLAQEAAYAEKLAELEKLQTEADINDVNDLSNVLSVIAGVSEFADEQQRDALLSGPFVERVFQVAMARAAEFESEGEWFDAYISCYSWLQSIDKDNEVYSDHSEELLDKANIVASFRD
ncbi:MAG: hypothetical protein JSW23_07635, partial [Planctomycetota bacterium]